MKIFLLFLAGIISLVSFAQDGSLDTSFGDGGVVVTDLGNSQEFGFSVAQQADQKLVVSGITSPSGNEYYPYLVRYMPDGSMDTTFGMSGVVTADYGSGFNSYAFLFVDSQEKIVAAGTMNQGSGAVFIVARYLENGQLDSSFGINGVASLPGGSNMVLLPDDSFLLLRFTASDEVTISHYLSDGALDTSFGANGYAVSNFSGDSFSTEEIKIDGQGNIFLLGTHDYNANSDIILMKFEPNGYLDSNFGNNGLAIKNIDALNPMNFSDVGFDFTNDGKIAIAGSCGACLDIFEPVMQPFLIRYQNDGSPDPNFGNNGTILLPVSRSIFSQLIIQENQRMLVSGRMPDCFEGSIYAIRRYFEGGSIDNSFNGASLEFENYKTILQQDGKIITVGNTFWYNGDEDIVLLRHNNDALSAPEFENQKTTVYPNPSNGIFTVERKFYSEEDAYLITDVTGKIIATGQMDEKQTQIDLSAAQSGVYFLKTNAGVFRLLKN